ncbi:deoxyribose-phosphate aldolase [Terriglobus aquaticus]|uniref:Deoxyribose-phosphate aldolase n=1 Tax=Terriglobus aquaticus TaxID=940139 RepID=A0ABW9KLJ7_9BACT|nr:deoxyribose-phosphate aldolase [Terriglobus aquaticus]
MPAPAQTPAQNQALTPAQLAAVLDHTLLKPEATRAQVERLCEEAAEYKFACAMVNPCWVPLAVDRLHGSGVPVGVVIGFPLGASLSGSKVDEAQAVLRAGAHDVDMVLNIGFLKSGMHAAVQEEIAAIADVVHGGGILKVILETALLTEDEKRAASELSVAAGADFIKTSTGFASGGATVPDLRLMRSIAGDRCGVKASGGIRTLADAIRMLEAGANRIGASASVAIVNELAGGAAAAASGY